MSPRKPDFGELLVEAALRRLASREYGMAPDDLISEVVGDAVSELFARDERIVSAPSKFQSREVVDRRTAALTREPEPVEEAVEPVAAVEDYVVSVTPGLSG